MKEIERERTVLAAIATKSRGELIMLQQSRHTREEIFQGKKQQLYSQANF